MSDDLHMDAGSHWAYCPKLDHVGNDARPLQICLNHIATAGINVDLKGGTLNVWLQWDELCRIHHDTGSMIAQMTKEIGVADTQAGDGDGGNDVASVDTDAGPKEPLGFLSTDMANLSDRRFEQVQALRNLVARAIRMALMTDLIDGFPATTDQIDIVLGDGWELTQAALGDKHHYREEFGTMADRAVGMER